MHVGGRVGSGRVGPSAVVTWVGHSDLGSSPCSSESKLEPQGTDSY